MTPALAALAQGAAGSDAAGAELDRLIETLWRERLYRSPELATTFGLDSGEAAAAKSWLDDRSLAAVSRDRGDIVRWRRQLEAIDRKALSGQGAVHYDVVAAWLRNEDEANRSFGSISGRPYALSHMEPAATALPEFLRDRHEIKTRADAEAYLARLGAFATALDQETERLGHDAALRVVPPDFVLAKAIGQIAKQAAEPPEDALVVKSLVDRTKNIPGDYGNHATRIYVDQIVPALVRQVAALAAVHRAATHDAGIWKLKDGDACYAAMLRLNTTTDKSAGEIHELGLEQAGWISGQLDPLLRAQGLTQGTVGQRLQSMFQDPKYQYPSGEEGKVQLMEELQRKFDEVERRLNPDSTPAGSKPVFFKKSWPRATVELKRATNEEGAGAYYQGSNLAGTRPGVCYFTLGDMTAWPKWRPVSILYHESRPGHHLQIALAMEKEDLPRLFKSLEFAAYAEGWALYAEQLADEIGMYEHDALSRIGYLHAALLRAGRLVADTGLHAMRWSRERATDYYAGLMGFSQKAAKAEIDRYCVMPGQACSYMIGKITWLELRQRAQSALGPRFDIRGFHDAGLSPGPMPLTVLDSVIDEYIRANRG
jgi:uncharacterized protein (DUF885 family)